MQARTPKKNSLIAEIQNTFYNKLGESALEAEDILPDNINDWMKTQIAIIITDILEIKNIVDIQPAQRELDETGITAELIRSTFYNEMPNQTLQAIMNELISRQDLEDLENYIFFALSALTIIEAINQSKDFAGILL